jgi:murein DD-endopeptidase MepM/ murein hydrolase activator NlpD
MRTFLLVLLCFFLFSCGRQFRFATSEESKKDTSFIYSLPYPRGTSHFIVQGYNSRFSHRGRLGLDFIMRLGSPVTAARAGVVVALEEGNKEGGANRKYFRKANYVTVRHADGSLASYGHLQYNGVDVAVGDTVQQGQVIARSGSTGYSAMPHLHFSAWKPGAGGRNALPTRFRTKKGIRYLKVGRWYRAV